jgi:asparagine synthase (glutamine-hydrolysing)
VCGIAGVFAYRGGGPVEVGLLERLRDLQRHRGPDDAGNWISDDRRVGLAHRRLSIIDLSPLGHQPMATKDGRLRVVFNGEIYNFRALRSELEQQGFVFASESDTEVLLHGWRAWGEALFDRLRGMFAFALHDAERDELVLARDPLGIKPLYVADDGARLAFASEVQALRGTVGGGGLDAEGLASFLLWGSVPAPRTLYRGIRALPAGCWMRVNAAGASTPRAYWRLEQAFGATTPMDAEEARASLRDALVDSVRHHLVSDVPVGAFLSGGVDSSALVGLLSELHSGPVRTVTLSFDVAELDEAALAAEAAQLYGTEHQVVKVGVEDARARIPDAVRCLDQPSVDGINTYFVSEAAVRAGLKVAVSGVGGDELFGGYDSFTRIPRIRRVHDRITGVPGLRSLIDPLGRAIDALPRTTRGPKLAMALRYGGDELGAFYAQRGLFSPAEARALLAPELAEAVAAADPRVELAARLDVASLPPDERVSALEMGQYMQMQLLRVDRELLRRAAQVPADLRRAGPAKRQLREAPRPPVPDALWNRRKQGFTLPFDRWLRTGALPLELPGHPWLRPAALRAVTRDFERGRVHWSRLWALLVLRPFLE